MAPEQETQNSPVADGGVSIGSGTISGIALTDADAQTGPAQALIASPQDHLFIGTDIQTPGLFTIGLQVDGKDTIVDQENDAYHLDTSLGEKRADGGFNVDAIDFPQGLASGPHTLVFLTGYFKDGEPVWTGKSIPFTLTIN